MNAAETLALATNSSRSGAGSLVRRFSASCLAVTLRRVSRTSWPLPNPWVSGFDSKVDIRDLKREQAVRKAKKLVALVQGTSGLEGQAVGEKDVESMVKQTTHELLAGSKRRLWSDE